MTKKINNIDEFDQAINNDTYQLAVIDFFGTWCRPCMNIAPFYQKLAEKYQNVGFYKINVDEPHTKEILKTCEISVYPTFCIFCMGKYITKVEGADPGLLESTIRHIIQKQTNN